MISYEFLWNVLVRLKLEPDEVEEEGPTIPDIQPDEIMMKTKVKSLNSHPNTFSAQGLLNFT